MDLEAEFDLLREALPPEAAPPSALLSPWRPLEVRSYDHAGEYRGVTRGITDRFSLDETRVVLDDANGDALKIGDNVLWIGEAQDWDHPVVWAPAPVVGQTTLHSGTQFVQSIGDGSAVPLFTARRDWSQGEPGDRFCPRADVDPVLWQELTAGPRRVSPLPRFAVLQLFGQLDRCPRCAGTFLPMLFGMPSGPPTAHWPQGGLQPHDLGEEVLLAGCCVDESSRGAMVCRRCGLSSASRWQPTAESLAAARWPWTLWLAALEVEVRAAAGLRPVWQDPHSLPVSSAVGGWSKGRGPTLELRVRSGRGAERAVVVHERSGLVHRR